MTFKGAPCLLTNRALRRFSIIFVHLWCKNVPRRCWCAHFIPQWREKRSRNDTVAADRLMNVRSERPPSIKSCRHWCTWFTECDALLLTVQRHGGARRSTSSLKLLVFLSRSEFAEHSRPPDNETAAPLSQHDYRELQNTVKIVWSLQIQIYFSDFILRAKRRTLVCF